MLSNVKWLGHATLKFTGKKIIYIDPYQLKKKDAADLILITHDHYDHLSLEDIEKIRKENTIFVHPPSVKMSLAGDVRKIRIGEKITIDDIIIEAIASYNIKKDYHPLLAGNIGYIITIDNVRYYHAGDTDVIPEMDGLNVDVAFLPVGGTYTMSAKEAAKAAEIIRPKIAVPIHYGSIVGSIDDAKLFAELCSCDVKILPKEV
ncbi:MAG: MBL fold metallo-hydrolase [Candidatus Marinimicrobia bacterium]|nr:MBL fold metallo-hydrolase [Candidatus Neomarinimicrobiota bacterium]